MYIIHFTVYTCTSNRRLSRYVYIYHPLCAASCLPVRFFSFSTAVRKKEQIRFPLSSDATNVTNRVFCRMPIRPSGSQIYANSVSGTSWISVVTSCNYLQYLYSGCCLLSPPPVLSQRFGCCSPRYSSVVYRSGSPPRNSELNHFFKSTGYILDTSSGTRTACSCRFNKGFISEFPIGYQNRYVPEEGRRA